MKSGVAGLKLSMSIMVDPEKSSVVQLTEMNPAKVEPALDIWQVHDIACPALSRVPLIRISLAPLFMMITDVPTNCRAVRKFCWFLSVLTPLGNIMSGTVAVCVGG